MANECKGCKDEPGVIEIRLQGRSVFLGVKCYEKAMTESVWDVLKKDPASAAT